MADDRTQLERLKQVVDLAQIYRGWSRAELAAAMKRDPSNLLPESGNPKLDMVMALAEVLDWPVGDVAESLCDRDDDVSTGSLTFASANEMSLAAHRDGDYRRLTSLAKQMLALASSGAQRAQACLRMAGAFDGLGRYSKALEWMQAAISEPGLAPASRALLLGNLANAHYSLWHLVEARALALEVLTPDPTGLHDEHLGRVAIARAEYVAGHATRRLLAIDSARARFHAAAAKAHLETAERAYCDLAISSGDVKYSGVANTCRGGLLEIDVELGVLTPTEATSRILAGLESVIDVNAHERGDWLESWGWWAIFGCNISLRHLAGDELHRSMAIFTNKAMEIADRQDNWSMRERAFTLEHFRKLRVGEAADVEGEWNLDVEDLRTLAGTMGRFPQFRPIGWQILRSARLVGRED